ncbi:MAG: nucleotidyltransferase domain-containing protein [Actinobacteria bacterium]|nr:nucleotidyltransferase domain-containing protein [Actinomycetota bacterium]
MVKLNEKAVVPVVDDAARARLAHSFDREGVVATMLIGSQARGNPGPLSDIDIAYWHEPGLDRRARWQLRLDLIGAAEETLRTPEVDLAPLNEAPPLLQQRSIRDGVRLVERDRYERVRLETRAILDYLDTQHLRGALRKGLKRRVEEGALVDAEPRRAPRPQGGGAPARARRPDLHRHRRTARDGTVRTSAGELCRCLPRDGRGRSPTRRPRQPPVQGSETAQPPGPPLHGNRRHAGLRVARIARRPAPLGEIVEEGLSEPG